MYLKRQRMILIDDWLRNANLKWPSARGSLFQTTLHVTYCKYITYCLNCLGIDGASFLSLMKVGPELPHMIYWAQWIFDIMIHEQNFEDNWLIVATCFKYDFRKWWNGHITKLFLEWESRFHWYVITYIQR